MNSRKNLSLGSTRQRLEGAQGKKYWRSLEELADSAAFQELVSREFPEQASEWADPLSRRQFLLLMGASLGLAGLSGCSTRPAPAEKIVPYVRAPEEIIPGKPLFFATAMTLGGFATGLLVESHEGRPTKIEGNPNHPACPSDNKFGPTDAFAQASVLTLYDPDRSQTVTERGQVRTWDAAVEAIRKVLDKQRPSQGAGLRVLTETVTSPTLFHQLQGFLKEFPKARWHQYEPVNRDNILAGARLAFGQAVNTYYDFKNADVILSLDADFLSCGPGHLRYVRDFTARRRVGAEKKEMNRLYVVECTPTNTGAKADHRLPLRAGAIAGFARAIAAATKLGAQGIQVEGAAKDPWIDPLARDLKEHRGRSLILAGDQQPPVVHALAHAMNHALGNVSKTVFYTAAVEADPTNQVDSLKQLVKDLDDGRVEMLVILGGNPVFTAPVDLEFEKHLQKVPFRMHLSLYQDETSRQCHWHVPEAHYLESWSDARAYDGTISIVQPLIEPLYGGKSAHELLAVLIHQLERPGYEIVRDYWRQHWRSHGSSGDFDQFWQTSLHDGVVAGTSLPALTQLVPKLEFGNEGGKLELGNEGERQEISKDNLEVVFKPDPTIYDGRFANNGWLQELPKPLTKLTWDNAVLMSPATAKDLGLNQQSPGWHGGEHGEIRVDVAELQLPGRRQSVKAPVWIMPGQPDHSVTVHLGYGRRNAGKVGTDTGFDCYQLRTSNAPWFDTGLTISPTGEHHTLACTQFHQLMENRHPVRVEGELRAEKGEPKGRQPLTLYPEDEANLSVYNGYKWGMTIDLTACVGCKACVVACQAENNIPVVGKDQVTRGREMHWLRIDEYYAGPPENPETYFQPVPCMHCENAPCELVCPVGATVHSADGLNDMVYNRCVGTRYCSNACPYKVRRFNFLPFSDFATESLKLLNNPNVTVRSRGVMEKCTYCVQRIRAAEIQAKKEILDGTQQDDPKRPGVAPIYDGEVLTACQAACPAQAIIFGDMNDPKSKVTRAKAGPLHYALLEELNTKPRTTYLAVVRNPNPEMDQLK